MEQVRVDIGVGDQARDMVEGLGFAAPSTPSAPPRGPGRPRKPDIDLARLASLYVEELDSDTPSPTKALAERENYTPSYVRDALSEARARGLLTRPSKKGQPGGALTPKAEALLGLDR